MSDPSKPNETDIKPGRTRRLVGIAVALLVLAITLLVAWRYDVFRSHNIASEDAIIEANVVHIGPMVAGKLKTLPIEDAQRVSKGDLLLEIDPRTYELLERQARAQVELTRATLETQMRHIKAEAANAQIADEQIRRAQNNLSLTEKTLARLESLLPRGYVTAQEVDMARTAHQDAQVSLTQAVAQNKAAEALIGETKAAQAAVEAAEAGLAIAQKALADTSVHAPHDGLVVGLHVSEGEMLLPEQTLFTLVDTSAWYATALFREVELPEIQLGACATIYALSEPTRAMRGRVQSIGWGVVNEDLLRLPRMMPVVQKSLNWVRVAQRFPVRIRILDPIDDLMRVGASASVTIRGGTDCRDE